MQRWVIGLRKGGLRQAAVFGRKLPWADMLQAAVMLLLVQVRIAGTSPLAAAWLCAGGSVFWRWTGLALGAALSSGQGWWMMPALSGLLLSVRRLYAGEREMSAEGMLLCAGTLAVLDAAARTGAAVSLAPVWLLSGMLAVAAALPFAQGLPAAQRPLNVALAQSVECPGRRGGPVQAPARRKKPVDFPARQAANLMLAAGVSYGAAALLGGAVGVMLAALAAVLWQGMCGVGAALVLAAALCLTGVPAGASGGIAVLKFAMEYLADWPRGVRICGMLAAAGLWQVSGGVQAVYFAALLPAAAASVLTEDRLSAAQRARDLLETGTQDREYLRGRLEALADALGEMAQPCTSGPDPPREEEVLLSLRTRLCGGCTRYESCWNGRAGEGSRLLCELITRSVNGTLPERVLPDMMRRCLRASIIPERLYGELNRFSRARERNVSCMDGAQRARLTIGAAADVLRGMEQDAEWTPQQVRRIGDALRLCGIFDAVVTPALRGLVLTRADGWPQILRARAVEAVGRAMGVNCECSCCDGRAMVLAPAPAIRVQCGLDSVPAQRGSSGDSVHIGALDDRRQMVVISDGMGVGDSAAGESRRAVSAVVRLLRTGIAPERAAVLANQQLLAQGSGEDFATLDLCVIDTVRMEATWVKMAACDSYLIREHDCSVIPGGRLPMGIVTQAAPQVTVCRLKTGDVIVMGTDGAMEGLDTDAARRCLIAGRGAAADSLAKRMRLAGQERRIHEDDQTLAVIRVEGAGGVRQDTRREDRQKNQVRIAAGG